MVDLTATLNFEPSDYLDDGAFDRFYRPGLLDALGAVTEETAVHNPTNALIRLLSEDDNPNKLSPEEAQEKYGIGNLRFDEPVSEARAKDLHDMKLAEMRRQLVLSSVPTGIGGEVAKFGAGLLASLADPINIASAFIPGAVIRGGAAMRGVAAPSFLTGKGGTVGSRVLGGAAEGAIGAAMIEPLPYWAAQRDQLDYTLADSMLNIAFGTVIGGGLHGVAKVLENRREARIAAPENVIEESLLDDASLAGFISNLDGERKSALLRSAVSEMLDDKIGSNISIAIQREAAEAIRTKLSNVSFKANGELSLENVGRMKKFGGESPVAAIPEARFDSRKKADAFARSQKGVRFIIQRDESTGEYVALSLNQGSGVIREQGGKIKEFSDFAEAKKEADRINKLRGENSAHAVSLQKQSKKAAQSHIVVVGLNAGQVAKLKSDPSFAEFYSPNFDRATSSMEYAAAKKFGDDLLSGSQLSSVQIPQFDFSKKIENDFFADLDSLAEIDLATPKKLRRSEELKIEADEAVEKLRQESQALGGNKEFDAIMESADIGVKAAEAEADGWKFLGACMTRKG